jgi:hypothetical protein
MSASPTPPPLTIPLPPVVYTVTTHPQPQDLVELERFQLWWAPGAKRAFLLRTLYIGAVGATAMAALQLITLRHTGSGALVFAAALMIANAAFFCWRVATVSFRGKTLARESPEMLRAATYTIADQGLICEADGQVEVLPWAEFDRVLEGDGLIYLMLFRGPRFLPRRDFASPSASQQFLAQCRARVDASRTAG